MMKRKIKLLSIMLLIPLVLYVLPAYAIPSPASFSATDPSGDVYTLYSNDDGYMPMRDITGMNLSWDSTTLTITIEVVALTNTTAAWNNTGFKVSLGNGTGGQEWLPEWSSTHFNQTTAAIANYTYSVEVQNVTDTGGLKDSYVVYVVGGTYTYRNFTSQGVTVEIPSTPNNTIIIRVPWTAVGGIEMYSTAIYAVGTSFYCYGYGVGTPPAVIQKFMDVISPQNNVTIVPQPTWGTDPDGFDKYEAIIGTYYTIIPEFPTTLILLGTLLIITMLIVVAKKSKLL